MQENFFDYIAASNLLVASNLTVNGNADLLSNLSVLGDLTVSGNADLLSNLVVRGDLTANYPASSIPTSALDGTIQTLSFSNASVPLAALQNGTLTVEKLCPTSIVMGPSNVDVNAGAQLVVGNATSFPTSTFSVSGGPIFKQSPGFDFGTYHGAVGTLSAYNTHVITSADLGIPRSVFNAAGTLHVVVKGPATQPPFKGKIRPPAPLPGASYSPTLTSVTCQIGCVLKSTSYSVVTTGFSSTPANFGVNNTAMPFVSIAGSTTNASLPASWTITTDANCSIAWTFIGAC